MPNIRDKPKKEKKEKPKKRSQFHFVINTNVSQKQVDQQSAKWKRQFLERISEVVNYMKENINKFLKCNVDDSAAKKLTKFSAFLEIGSERGMYHVDGYCFLDRYCQFDNTLTNNFISQALEPFSNGAYWNVRFVPDSIAYVQDYASKDNNRIV